jgi:hypothetical protein
LTEIKSSSFSRELSLIIWKHGNYVASSGALINRLLSARFPDVNNHGKPSGGAAYSISLSRFPKGFTAAYIKLNRYNLMSKNRK